MLHTIRRRMTNRIMPANGGIGTDRPVVVCAGTDVTSPPATGVGEKPWPDSRIVRDCKMMPSGEKPVFVRFRVITRDVPSFICSTLPCHSVNPRLL